MPVAHKRAGHAELPVTGPGTRAGRLSSEPFNPLKGEPQRGPNVS
jgi:hypothetical protein